MTQSEFEGILDTAVKQLNEEVRADTRLHNAKAFEERVAEVLKLVAEDQEINISPTFHPHAFPDIRANGFGVEVKTTTKDSWLSVGNSIFEGMRDDSVEQIYVVFGKLGGMPAVKWGRYEEKITHVRISHAPRFVIEMEEPQPLFEKLEIPYEKFAELPAVEKMTYIRKYARGRLKPGERLWWIEDEESHGIPLEVRLYMNLTDEEKTMIRAQCVLLFPDVLGGKRKRGKYKDVPFFLLKYHNVIAPQTRDLFSAGSVAGKERGGIYLLRSIKKIQPEIKQAAIDLEDELFEEYWGISVKPEDRIKEWLKRADEVATEFVPSDHLFLNG